MSSGRIIEVKFEPITPIVMAGANQNEPEIRAQSIKGLLRWWFRFFVGSFCNSVSDLKKEEDKVFGCQDQASPFYITPAVIKDTRSEGYVYLCMNDSRKEGEQGARKNYNSIKRKGLLPSYMKGFTFKFTYLYSGEVDQSLLYSLFYSLWFLSTFGGIGARWRRGFGSVCCEISYDGPELPWKTGKEPWEDIQNGIEVCKKEGIELYSKERKYDDSCKEFTNFPTLRNSRIFVLMPKGNKWRKWEDAMDFMRDKVYRRFKKIINKDKIGSSGKDREASPLIIQIKKGQDGYYGILVASRIKFGIKNKYYTDEHVYKLYKELKEFDKQLNVEEVEL